MDSCSFRSRHPQPRKGSIAFRNRLTVKVVPAQDLREIFETIEAIPQAPKKLFEGLRSWARGEQDPTWRK